MRFLEGSETWHWALTPPRLAACNRQKAHSCYKAAFSQGERARGNWQWMTLFLTFQWLLGVLTGSHIPFKVLTSVWIRQSLQKGCFVVCFPMVTTLKSEESVSWKMVAFKNSKEPNPAISPSSFYKRLNNSPSPGGRGTPTSCSEGYQSSGVTNVTSIQCLRAHILSELGVRLKPRLI